METYKIEIQELLAKIVEIKAKSSNDAILKIQKKYKNEEIVLNYDDFIDVDFIDINFQRKEDEKNVLTAEIIEYLLNDEKKHFEEFEKKPENHIYEKLLRLKGLI